MASQYYELNLSDDDLESSESSESSEDEVEEIPFRPLASYMRSSHMEAARSQLIGPSIHRGATAKRNTAHYHHSYQTEDHIPTPYKTSYSKSNPKKLKCHGFSTPISSSRFQEPASKFRSYKQEGDFEDALRMRPSKHQRHRQANFLTRTDCQSVQTKYFPPKESTAFESFKEEFHSTTETYKCLDPAYSKKFVKGKVNLDTNGMIMIRGVLIHTVATWKSFIPELFKEGFTKFIEVASGSPPNLGSLGNCFRNSSEILYMELKQSFRDKSQHELAMKLLSDVNSSPSPPWAQFFTSFCQKTVEGNEVKPVFNSGRPRHMAGNEATNDIDTLFSNLFQTVAGYSLSEEILEIGKFSFKIRLNAGEETEVQIESADALHNISRLYFALSCAFTNDRKMAYNTLKDFPQNEEEFGLSNDRAAKYYLGLFHRINKYRDEASVSYLTFTNMVEFLKKAAFFLMRAVARWVYEATGGRGCIWGYKPHQ